MDRLLTGRPADITAVQSARAEWLQVIRSEYLEIPGLSLTMKQARRLWNLDNADCDALLAELTDAKFLRQTSAGAYVRTDSGVW